MPRACFHMLTDEAKLEEFRARERGRLLLLGSAASRASASTPSASAARSRSSAARSRFEIKIDRRAAASAGDQRARRRGARDHPADRHDRLGQVHDARGDDRPHQPRPREAHRHDRGPDRVPPPRQALDHQPARGRRGHRVLRARAAPRAAPGPGRDPGRRDARRGDGRAPRCPRPRPATSCSRRSTPSTRPRPSTASSTSSPSTSSAAGARDARRHAEGGRSRSGSCRPRTATAASPSCEILRMTGRVKDMIIEPRGDRPAARGDRRGRLLRHADLRPGAAHARAGRPRRDGRGAQGRHLTRTTSSCWSRRRPALDLGRVGRSARTRRPSAVRPDDPEPDLRLTLVGARRSRLQDDALLAVLEASRRCRPCGARRPRPWPAGARCAARAGCSRRPARR